MCGIAGLVNLDGAPADGETLARMGASVAHRGPDGSGAWKGGGAGLTHRRLSIIDIEGGAQPMVSFDGRYAIAYNGELYNFRELKRSLSGEYPFATASDTEVALAAFRKHGPACFETFDGIFALAVWDTAERTLYLARDQFGVKPLYYASTGKRLLFASEIKAILAAEPSLSRLSLKNLDAALTWRFSPSPGTLFETVKKVRPGHFITLQEGDLKERRYLPPPPAAIAMPEEEAAQTASRMMEDAVRSQLMADVPVGVLLSGGLDSSLVAAMAVKHYAGRMTAFTVGFRGDFAGNEIRGAAETAEHFGMRHETVEVAIDDFLPVLDEMTYHLEEPGATSSAVPLFMLCSAIRRTHKVVLSGQGADEQWGGYLRYLGERHASMLGPLVGSGPVKAVAALFPRAEKLKRAAASLGEADDETRYARERFLFDSGMRAKLLSSPFADDLGHIRYFRGDMAGLTPLQKALGLDLRTQLADDLLLYTDKVSMAHAVEVRVPFLSKGLVAWVESLPSDFKVKGLRRKRLFRKVAARFLPEFALRRKKAGFETPVDAWFGGELNGAVKDLLCGPSAVSKPLFVPGGVEGMIKTHAAGGEDFSKHLFMLLSLELWMRRFRVGI